MTTFDPSFWFLFLQLLTLSREHNKDVSTLPLNLIPFHRDRNHLFRVGISEGKETYFGEKSFQFFKHFGCGHLLELLPESGTREWFSARAIPAWRVISKASTSTDFSSYSLFLILSIRNIYQLSHFLPFLVLVKWQTTDLSKFFSL